MTYDELVARAQALGLTVREVALLVGGEELTPREGVDYTSEEVLGLVEEVRAAVQVSANLQAQLDRVAAGRAPLPAELAPDVTFTPEQMALVDEMETLLEGDHLTVAGRWFAAQVARALEASGDIPDAQALLDATRQAITTHPVEMPRNIFDVGTIASGVSAIQQNLRQLPDGSTTVLPSRMFRSELSQEEQDTLDAGDWDTEAEAIRQRARDAGLPIDMLAQIDGMLEFARGDGRPASEVSDWVDMLIESFQPELSEYLGVPPGASVTVERDLSQLPSWLVGYGLSDTSEVVPLYKTSAADEIYFWSPEALDRLQADLERAGFPGVDSMLRGIADSRTVSGWVWVLETANQRTLSEQRPVSWQEALRWLIDNPNEALAEERKAQAERDRADELSRMYQPSPYFEPDWSSLMQDVKSLFRQKLGRDPRDDELAFFGGQAAGYHREAYEAGEAVMRSIHDQTRTFLETGEGDPTAPVAGQAIDPAARLRELLEQRHGPEMRRFQDIHPDSIQNVNNVMQSLTTMDALIGR